MESKFRKLFSLLSNGDFSIDFVELRFSFASTSLYDPMSNAAEDYVIKGDKLFQEKQLGKALELYACALELNPLLMRAHYRAACVYNKLGRTAEDKFHLGVFRQLSESISRSGRGTFESPYVVINVSEIYDYLVLRHRMKTRGHRSMAYEGNPLDVMTVVDPETAEEFRVCFDISFTKQWQLAHIKAAIG